MGIHQERLCPETHQRGRGEGTSECSRPRTPCEREVMVDFTLILSPQPSSTVGGIDVFNICSVPKEDSSSGGDRQVDR
jgi:hypothetical protein